MIFQKILYFGGIGQIVLGFFFPDNFFWFMYAGILMGLAGIMLIPDEPKKKRSRR